MKGVGADRQRGKRPTSAAPFALPSGLALTPVTLLSLWLRRLRCPALRAPAPLYHIRLYIWRFRILVLVWYAIFMTGRIYSSRLNTGETTRFSIIYFPYAVEGEPIFVQARVQRYCKVQTAWKQHITFRSWESFKYRESHVASWKSITKLNVIGGTQCKVIRYVMIHLRQRN